MTLGRQRLQSSRIVLSVQPLERQIRIAGSAAFPDTITCLGLWSYRCELSLPFTIKLNADSKAAQASAAEQLSDIYLEVHAERASRPDLLGVVCLNAYQQARYGRYDRAFGMLKQQSSMPNKTLKMDNMILGFATMCRFREAMHQ